MRRYGLRLSSLLTVLAAVSSLPQILHGQVIYQTGFESLDGYSSGQLTGQKGWTGPRGPVVQSAVTFGGSQAVALAATGLTAISVVSQPINYNAVGSSSVSFDIRFFQSVAGNPSTWDVLSVSGDRGFIAQLLVNPTGTVSLGLASSTVGNHPVSRGAWNNFQLVLNFQSQTVSAFVNGDFIASGSFATPSTTPNGVAIGVTSPATDVGYFDNLTVTSAGGALPHLVMGPLGSDIWTTAVNLNNTTGSPAVFTLSFIQDTGKALPLGLGIYNETHLASIQQTLAGDSTFGTIPANGTLTLVLSSNSFVEGWGSLSGAGITAQAVFHRHTTGGADYEATVPLSAGGLEYQVPFDATTFFNGAAPVPALPYITGIALANLDAGNSVTITCAIQDQNGGSLGSATPITLVPLGHTALQLNASAGFGNVAGIGTLDCSSGGTSFAVLGLRFLGANDFTSFAATKIR
jgi:hypothetical protein